MATGLPDFEHLLRETLHSAARGDDSTALLEQLRTTVALQRAQERVRVGYVAELLRSGAFAARGYQRPESALANLLEVDRSEACRLVADGILEFLPPRFIDPEQHPRRHPRYLLPVP